jgi:hypothetical protein
MSIFWEPYGKETRNKDQRRAELERYKPPATLFELPPPQMLPVEALHVWNWYSNHLNNVGRFKAEHGRIFAQLCMYEAYLEKMSFFDLPPVVTLANGNVVANQELLVYDKMLSRVQRLWSQLALSPIYLLQADRTIEGTAEPAGSSTMFMPAATFDADVAMLRLGIRPR